MESSVRSLVVLDAVASEVDLDQIVVYDYFLVHSGDYPAGPASLHPPVPHRSGELLVRRDVVRAGLDFAQRKGLVRLRFDDDGVRYACSDIASAFLECFQSHYYRRLRQSADWIAKTLHTAPRVDLERFVKSNLKVWGGDNAQFLMEPSE